MDDSSGVSGVNLSSQVSVAVAKKAMDSAKDQGMAMVELIKQAMQDQPPVKDGRLDVYA